MAEVQKRLHAELDEANSIEVDTRKTKLPRTPSEAQNSTILDLTSFNSILGLWSLKVIHESNLGLEESEAVLTANLGQESNANLSLHESEAVLTANLGKFETLEQLKRATLYMEAACHYEHMSLFARGASKRECYNDELRKFEDRRYAQDKSAGKSYQNALSPHNDGQMSAFFLDGHNLGNGKRQHTRSLDMFMLLAANWLRIAIGGQVSRLEDFAEVEDGEGKYDTDVERFKAFLAKFKRRHVFGWRDEEPLRVLLGMTKMIIDELRDEWRAIRPSGKTSSRFQYPYLY
jgi:hypothetical protein